VDVIPDVSPSYTPAFGVNHTAHPCGSREADKYNLKAWDEFWIHPEGKIIHTPSVDAKKLFHFNCCFLILNYYFF